MDTLILPFIALMLELLLMILFYSGERDINDETKIYSHLLVVNFIDIVISIISFVYAKIVGNELIIGLMQKVYMSLLVLLTVYINCYNIKLLKFKKTLEKILIKVYFVSFYIVTLACFITPLTVVNHDNVLDGFGISYDIVLVATIVYLVSIIIYALMIFKKNQEFKKNIPFAFLILFYIISIYLRKYIPNVMFENFLFAYVFIIMYFTIENPDLKLLRQMELAKDQAEKANRAKSDFLSSMSHEIRTPLNAIVGLSEDNLSYKDQLPHDVVENSEDIMSASQTLLEIVGNILDINKIEANKMEIIESPYNFKEEIENLAKIDATRIGEKPIDFKINIAEDIPYELLGDKIHMKEIVNNLLTNAIKYTDQGEIELNVKCINQKDICNLIISVKDTGKGIKADHINRLFNKFDRLDVELNTTTEGTGLGLAITKALVEMMGGKINVQSQFGKGSIFMVQVPQKISKLFAPIQVKQQIEIDKTDSSNMFGDKKILIVDDNKLNIKVARKALQDFNFEIDECYDGQECLDKVITGSEYDLILMDIMMPNMSGETALKKLKENPSFNIPTIALTADAISGAEEKYKSEGFVDYIAKPFKKEQIKEKLDMIFSKQTSKINAQNETNNFEDVIYDMEPSDDIVPNEDDNIQDSGLVNALSDITKPLNEIDVQGIVPADVHVIGDTTEEDVK
ncbi:MAG: response regulator [Bacilli bacterium]|nr:response regulator [Bacilli bacterium]